MLKKCGKCGNDAELSGEALLCVARCKTSYEECAEGVYAIGIGFDVADLWNRGVRSYGKGHKDTVRVQEEQFRNNRDHYIELSREKNVNVVDGMGRSIGFLYIPKEDGDG